MENKNLEIEILKVLKENKETNKYNTKELFEKLYNELGFSEQDVADNINSLESKDAIKGCKQSIDKRSGEVIVVESQILEITEFGEDYLRLIEA